VPVEAAPSRLRRAERQLGRDLGREPTREELADALGAAPDHVDELLRWRRDPASLDAAVDDAGETPMGDLLEDPEGVSPEAEVLALDDLAGLGRLLERLPERESAILRARFGMEDGQPLSYAQIGARYGLSHNRVRQITDRSLRRLRQLATETDRVGRATGHPAQPAPAHQASQGPRAAEHIGHSPCVPRRKLPAPVPTKAA
jgi:RNA polymerase sigma factor (sigma-70 family)